MGQNCANLMNSHEYDIAHFPVTLTNVSLHFNFPRHSVQDNSFMPIDKVSNIWETTWMYVLGSLSPMNSKIIF